MRKSWMKKKTHLFSVLIVFLLLAATVVTVWYAQKQQRVNQYAAVNAHFLYASVDTMKESMDTDTNQLTPTQIADDVNLAATLKTTHITVDVHWDYPTYMQEWISAVRAAGKHVWFRIHPNAWEGNYGVTATMTPSQYLSAESAFILAHPTFFQSGDILDMNPEPENSPYWVNTYGANWSWQNAPNAGTDAYNQFVLGVTTTANSALAQLGITGVNTNVRSMSEWYYENPTALYNSTISQFGVMTVDSYPDQNTTDPTTAANDWLSVLSTIENTHPGIPIIIAEMGYSNAINVSDTTQEQVLKAELNAFESLSYIEGLNYWVGAGTANSGGYTHIFTGSTGNWSLRPAATDLANYYAFELGSSTITPTPSVKPTPTTLPTPTPSTKPSAIPTPTYTPTPTPKPTSSPTPSVMPSATPTPTPLPGTTTLSFPSILLHGIGSAGDSVAPGTSGNTSPLTPNRTLTVQVVNASNVLVTTLSGTITYSPSSGGFSGSVSLGSTVPTGSYLVKVKTDKYLVKQLPGIITLTQGQTTTIPPVSLIVGDINNDNTLNILDYNILLGCYSDFTPPTSCPGTNGKESDLNDDGSVNASDYNLFLRELSVQSGE